MPRPRSKPEIQIVPNVEDLALAGALHFVYQGKRAIEEKNLFTVAMSGDSLCAAVCSRLADDSALIQQLSWQSVHFFCTAARPMEREKAPHRDQMACAAMLKPLPLPPLNIHRIEAGYPSARAAAAAYERQLRKFFALKLGQWPRFDLVLLGIGADDPGAPLNPAGKALREEKHLVVAERIGPEKTCEIALSLAVLDHAACVIFLGAADPETSLLRHPSPRGYQPHPYSFRLIRPKRGKLLWLLDERAARLLGNIRNE